MPKSERNVKAQIQQQSERIQTTCSPINPGVTYQKNQFGECDEEGMPERLRVSVPATSRLVSKGSDWIGFQSLLSCFLPVSADGC